MNNPNVNVGGGSGEVLTPAEQAVRDQEKVIARKALKDAMDALVPPPPASNALPQAVVKKTSTLVVGNFTGQLEWEAEKQGNTILLRTLRYRITRKYPQQGGNKANIECSMATYHPSSPHMSIISGDNMYQDDIWRDWKHQRTIEIEPGATYLHKGATFIFDRSGNDQTGHVIVHVYLSEFV